MHPGTLLSVDQSQTNQYKAWKRLKAGGKNFSM